MLKLGILVSGGGTNLQAIINSLKSGYLSNCELVTVISNKKDAYALTRAANYGADNVCIARSDYQNKNDYDKALIDYLNEKKVDLVVLAGFMLILGNDFINEFKNRIVNVHPALIPSFCGEGYYGLRPHQAALEYGVKVTGATVHFVEAETDAGPIILQKAVYIKENDTAETLQKRVMEEAEWEILPEAIKLISEGKISVEGRIVRIDN